MTAPHTQCQPEADELRQHTPTPWAVEENCLGVYPLSARQGPLTVHPAKAFGEADAAFIVEAVNNHDTLLNNVAVMHKHMSGAAADITALQARVEELTKALRGLDTLLDFSDENVGTVWQFEDVSSIQDAFAEAHRALSVSLEGRGGAT